MNHAFEFHLNQLLDEYDDQHRRLEAALNSVPRQTALTMPTYYESAHQLAHAQANALAALVDEQTQPAAAETLRHHPIHSQILLQSAFIRHAYVRPYGYPGDKDLMLMICQQCDAGDTNYAVLQNRVYLNLPAAAAVRQRVHQMAAYLAQLPAHSKVLNLACGPALEVSQFFAAHPDRPITFDLIDHDPQTLLYTQTHLAGYPVRYLLGNAFHLAHGQHHVALAKALDPAAPTTPPQTEELWLTDERYDLVYSMGLYDYLPYHPGQLHAGTIGLTKLLFDLVKPGGELMIGNFLALSPQNAHTWPHHLMMELYANWPLRYRTERELLGFLEAIAPTRYRVSLTNEAFDPPPLHRGVIGFLCVSKES